MRKLHTKIRTILFVIFIFTAISCSEKSDVPKISGAFEGKAEGFLGPISVKLIIEDNEIKHIDILEYSDTPGYSNVVFNYLPKTVITKNSSEVDTISGATISSKAFLDAVNDALKNAGIK